MAEVTPVYQDVSGNYVAFTGVSPTGDSITLGGLTMNGAVVMGTNKITGLGAATSSADALSYGQSSASLAGLTLTDALAMGTNKITGVGDATDPQDVPSFTQLQSVAAGVSWKHSVTVFRMVNDVLAIAPTLVLGDKGKAYVVAGIGGNWSTFSIGDIVEWDGAAWNLILANSGAEPPDGTYAIIVEASAAGSFAGEEDQVAVYNATTNTWVFTVPINGEGRTVDGEDSVYENLGYVYDSTPGGWVMFNGPGQILAGAGLTKVFNELSVNVKDGVQIDSDSVTLLLASGTPDPGLQLTGTSPAKVLSVLPDGTKGVEVGSSGIAVKIETDGAIVFDGTNGGLEVNLESTNPTLDITTNELGVKYSTTASGLDQDANGLKVKVDGVTTTINGSGQVVAAAGDPGRVADDYAVFEAIVAGDPVYWSTTADRVAKGDAAKAQWPTKAQISGVSEDTQATPGSDATIVSQGPCLSVLTTATPGTVYWLGIGGGITATIPTANNSLIRAGWAMNADDLFVAIADYGRAGV